MTGNVTITDNIVMDNTAGGIIIQVPAHTTTGEIVVRRNLATRNAVGFVIFEGNFPAGRVRLEENIASDNGGGFLLTEFAHEPRRGPGHLVIRNVATRNRTGFSVRSGGNTFTGNLAVANSQVGIESRNDTAVANEISGNSLIANAVAGISLFPLTGDGRSGIHRNNIYGNGEAALGCGLINDTFGPVDVTDNYWGRPNGPSPNPGDRAHGTCVVRGSTVSIPFSSTPFPIEAPSMN